MIARFRAWLSFQCALDQAIKHGGVYRRSRRSFNRDRRKILRLPEALSQRYHKISSL